MSSDARLESLSVEPGKLTPEFSTDVLEYSVELTDETTELAIYASAWSSDAHVYGAGSQEIKLGENIFETEVHAEDGTVQTYKMTVKVKETPKVFLKYQDRKLGILSEADTAIIPKGFKEKKIEIEDKEVNSLVSENGAVEIVYAIDEENKEGFYLYSEDEGIYSSYSLIRFNAQNIYVLDVAEKERTRDGLIFDQLKIGSQAVGGWTFFGYKAR